jgi:FMN phosphatase YigB (HAD superfamily)
MVISSGSAREFLNYLAKDIKPYFSKVFSSISDYKQVKTPHFFSTVCREIGADPAEVVHVGDNLQFDFHHPMKAGIRSFYLDRQGQKGTVESVSTLSDLASLLL